MELIVRELEVLFLSSQNELPDIINNINIIIPYIVVVAFLNLKYHFLVYAK